MLRPPGESQAGAGPPGIRYGEAMSDQGGDPQREDPRPAPTPFDHPLFLPVVLGVMTLWFAFDVFFNPKMMEEHPSPTLRHTPCST